MKRTSDSYVTAYFRRGVWNVVVWMLDAEHPNVREMRIVLLKVCVAFPHQEIY